MQCAETISVIKLILKIKAYKMTFHRTFCYFVLGSCEKFAWDVYESRE